jgi:ElaB/YqjD/DUF883 family membrane-anchored ribosome-binding protein
MITDRFTRVSRQTSNDIQQRWKRLTKDDLAEVKSNMRDLGDVLQERYGYTRAQAEKEVRSFWNDHKDQMYDTARRMPGKVDRQVKRHPWASFAAALGLGFAVGYISKPSANGHSREYREESNRHNGIEHDHDNASRLREQEEYMSEN